MGMKISRHACPRNCYGTCSMLSYVENGKLIKVTGDSSHGFTKGKLCAKGYSYKEYVYNPLRLKYPIMQSPRGSGNWQRITWDEAYTIIANKIIELYERYGSNLSLGYNKFSGNLGLLHFAVEGMFNSIGPHTKPTGNVCLATGAQAIIESFGKLVSADPEQMANARTIVIWGANPAVTNVHQMKFIFEAKKRGAKLIVIDPIFSETAEKADVYIQINPGTDALLALGISKLIVDSIENDTLTDLQKHTNESEQFINTVKNDIDLNTVTEITGVPLEAIKDIAKAYKNNKPVATWNGFGLQRNKFGGKSVKLINSLVALSGNMYLSNGGIYYANDDLSSFPQALYNFPEKKHETVAQSRKININNYAIEASELADPPLKFLWTAARSTFSQDHNLKTWEKLLDDLELIVTVDLFMTSTAKQSDIVLPAASHFEEEDLHVGYWHHWLSINEKAISPYYEAKSDLKIARELTTKLNELSPGFSTFPAELKPLDWIEKELSPEIKESYGIKSYRDLLDGPKQRIKQTANSTCGSHTFSFIKRGEVNNLIKELTEVHERENEYEFRLITPQSLLKIHTQFSAVSWLHPRSEKTIVEINDTVASDLQIINGEKVTLYNKNGSIVAQAKLNPFLPKDVVSVEQTNNNSINQLLGNFAGEKNLNDSTHFYDSYVNITK